MQGAARITDPIEHTSALSGLLTGLLIGAAIAVAAIAIVGTGGLAAVAIVGAGAAMGAGVGELVGSMSFAKSVSGAILQSGSSNTNINSLKAARAHVDVVECSKHPNPPKPIATGSSNVFINSMPAARVGDKTGCDAEISGGSKNVFIGGGTVQTDEISPEVPGWLHTAVFAVGMASAVVLAGPVVAFAGLIGGLVGGAGGNWLGGKMFGQGSDGQKVMTFAGAMVGGFLGGKGGAWFDRNYVITTEGLGSNFGNVKITPRSALENVKTTPEESFVGKLRGEDVELPGVKTQSIEYTKRAPEDLETLRGDFNKSGKTDFLNEITSDPVKVQQLKAAGLTDGDIETMQAGKNPPGWQVHHKLPLDDGGTNATDNLVLIKNEPYHKVITNEQMSLTRGMEAGQTKVIDFPIPDGIVYPPTPITVPQ